MLTDEPGRPSQAEIAQGMSMSENAVKQAFYRLRQRYRLLLREEIAHTVAVPRRRGRRVATLHRCIANIETRISSNSHKFHEA